jgi:hypothetical protein
MALSLKPKEQFFWEPQLGTSIGSRYRFWGPQNTVTKEQLNLKPEMSIRFPHMSLACHAGMVPKHNAKKHSSNVCNLWKDLSLLSLFRMVNLGPRLELFGPRNVAAAEELLKV